MSETNETSVVDKEQQPKPKYRVRPRYYSGLNRKNKTISFEVHLPGVSKDQVSLKVLPDLFHLEAPREMEDSEIIYTLSRYLPYEIDPDTIESSCGNGLLKFTLKIKDPLSEAVDIKLE